MSEETATEVAESPQDSVLSAGLAEQTGTWLESIPTEFREDPSLTKYKSMDDMVKGHVSLSKMIGNSYRVPTEESPPEEWSEFYDRIGRPESPDKYEYAKPELPNGVEYDENIQKSFLEEAHAKGLTQDQVKFALDFHNKYVSDQVIDQHRNQEMDRTTSEAELKKRWGPQFYEQNVSVAQRGMNAFVDEKTAQALSNKGYLNDPNFIELMFKVGKGMSEAKMVDAESEREFMDKEKAQAEADSIQKMEAYWNETAPDHEKLKKRFAHLYDYYIAPEE